MKVAIAGAGNVAQYLIPELSASGHEVIVLTRKSKPELSSYTQRETDYSIESLKHVLADCDALVSTVSDYTDFSVPVRVHNNMLSALQQLKASGNGKCQTFIPSEWTLNIEDYPSQPMFETDDTRAFHDRLKSTTDIRWTIISNSWFAEYVLPQSQRHLRDIGEAWPMDHASKTFTIYGPGTQLVNLASVRDVARAVAAMLHQVAAHSSDPPEWSPYTYISGDTLTWNALFDLVKQHDPQWTSVNKPLADTVRQLQDASAPAEPGTTTAAAQEQQWRATTAMFELQSYSGALTWPAERTHRDRARHFGGVRFRTVEDLLKDAAAASPGVVV